MAKFSFLLSALVACLVALSATAFAPMQTCPRQASPTALNVNVGVEVGDGEPVESALRRWKRAVSSSGHLIELRHKRYFENKQERKKRKIKEAGMRRKFERMQRKRMAKRT